MQSYRRLMSTLLLALAVLLSGSLAPFLSVHGQEDQPPAIAQDAASPDAPLTTPDVIARSTVAPPFLLHDNVIYWADNPTCAGGRNDLTIYRMRAGGIPIVSGADVRTLFVRFAPIAGCATLKVQHFIGVAGDSLYWQDNEGVARVPLTSNAGDPLLRLTGPVTAFSQFLLADGYLYWLDANGLVRIPDHAAPGTPIERVASFPVDSGAELVDGGDNLYGLSNYFLWRYHKATGARSGILFAGSSAVDLQYDGRNIYYLRGDSLRRVDPQANFANTEIDSPVGIYKAPGAFTSCGDGALQWLASSGGSGSYRALAYAHTSLADLRFGDFNGDKQTDVFTTLPRADGARQWVYSSAGAWSFANLAYAYTNPNDLRFGDFNGDGKTDVFTAIDAGGGNYQWQYSPGGVASFQNLTFATVPPQDLRFGDFNGDGKTDVFAALPRQDGALQWVYSPGGAGSFQDLNFASTPLDALHFADVNGDGKTDVITFLPTGDGRYTYVYSSGGVSSYVDAGVIDVAPAELRFGDFNGDKKADLFSVTPRQDGLFQWRYLGAGSSTWQNLAFAVQPLDALRFGDFDGDGKTDVFATLLRAGCKQVIPLYYASVPALASNSIDGAISPDKSSVLVWRDLVSGQQRLLDIASPQIGTGSAAIYFERYEYLEPSPNNLYLVDHYFRSVGGFWPEQVKTLRRIPAAYDFYAGLRAAPEDPIELWSDRRTPLAEHQQFFFVPQADEHFVFWRSQTDVLRLPWDATAPVRANLRLTGMEVTQGIQTQPEVIRPIRGRKTYVRLFAASDGADVADVPAEMYVSVNGGAWQGPVRPERNITVRRTPNRRNAADSYTFVLPFWAVTGTTLRLRAVLNPSGYPAEPEGATNDNVLISTNYPINPSPRMDVVFVEYSYFDGTTTQRPQYTADNVEFLKLVYPLGYVQENDGFAPGLTWRTWQVRDEGFRRRIDTSGASDAAGKKCMNLSHVCVKSGNLICDANNNVMPKGNRLNECASDYSNAWLAANRARIGASDATILYGAMPNAARGNSPLNSRVGSGPDADSTRGYYAGHEIGHSLGLGHPRQAAGQCTMEMEAADPTPSYPDARIGPTGDTVTGFGVFDNNNDGIFGYSVLTPSTGWYDVMAYCRTGTAASFPRMWISDENYRRLYDILIPGVSASATRTPISGDFLAAFGSIAPDGSAAGVQLLERWDSTMDVPAIVPGPYRLRLLGAGGSVLAETAFAPAADDTGEGDWLPFELVVPFAAGAQQVMITRAADGAVLFSRAVSANAPTITAVNAVANGSTVNLTWQASDPDGDALSYDVYVAPDGAADEQPVWVGLDTASATIDISNTGTPLGEGTHTFRIYARDGVNSAHADSNGITTPALPPQIRSLTPACPLTVSFGSTVNLAADAWDVQDGTLAGDAFAWTLNGAAVASGPVVSFAATRAGANALVVKATNSHGLSAEMECTLNVVDDLSIPPATLSAAPDAVVWHTSSQAPAVQSIEITVASSGEGILTWTATTDAPWLTISQTEGFAPATMTVTADPAGLASGQAHSGQVTFAAQDTKGNTPPPVVLPVTLWVDQPENAGAPTPVAPSRSLFLPLLLQGDAAPQQDLVVYDDVLAAGWQNWSWDSAINLDNTSPVKTGAKSISVKYNGGWAALSLRSSAPISTSGYQTLSLWVYGAPGGNQLSLYTQPSDSGAASPFYNFTASAGTWTQITIPLSALGNPAAIQRLNLQDATGAAQPIFYLDDLRLLK